MKKTAPRIGRRRFIRSVPAAVAATVTLPAMVQGQRGGGAPPKFGKDVLKCAERIDGLHFTDAEEEMAVAGVSRNLDSYEELRRLNVPLDTEPAMTFRPYRGRHRGQAAAARNIKLAVAKPRTVQVTSNLEDLAFEPVTVLASLIESRVRRRTPASADDHRPVVRRGQRAARGARLRARDEVAHDESGGRRELEDNEHERRDRRTDDRRSRV